VFRENNNPDYLHFYRNFSPEDYLRLIKHCACLVGNSSSGLREGVFMGVPCVNIGTRQHGRERGINVIDVPYKAEAIEGAIGRQIAHGAYEQSALFGNGTAGTQIADILAASNFRIQKTLSYVS
jgi:UDP-N-acetylglucosamine 2-epimerase